MSAIDLRSSKCVSVLYAYLSTFVNHTNNYCQIIVKGEVRLLWTGITETKEWGWWKCKEGGWARVGVRI